MGLKKSPARITLTSALIVAIASCLWLFFVDYILTVDGLLKYAVCFLGITLITFLVFFSSLTNYIKYRVSPIYKLIYKLKKSKQAVTKNSIVESLREPILDDVEREVILWAKDRNKEIEELKSTEVFRREYIGNVSHELKTPVFNTQGYIYTLLEGGLEDENINMSYLQKAANNIERLQNIIQDLESISTLESSDELDLQSFNMVDLLQEAKEDFTINASEKEIEIRLNVQEETVDVYADRERIRQVITNLVSNSIKYGKKEGTTVLSVFDMESYALIEIQDDGIGMDAVHTKRIFERFYRVDKGRSREMGGTGLGLSIVKHIIENHDQTIEVKSAKGEGTSFSFTLDKP